jgi:hypothetical protein
MKDTCLLVLMIGCAVLTHGRAYANAVGPTSQQTSPESLSDHSQDGELAPQTHAQNHQNERNLAREPGDHGHGSAGNHPRSGAGLPRANRPTQFPNRRERFPSGIAMNLRNSGSNKSGGAAKGGLIRQGQANGTQSLRTPDVVRPRAPSLNNVRHRGANPAVIGGAANSDARDSGAINGTRVHRKP